MDITVTEQDGVHIIAVAGEVDLGTSAELRAAVMAPIQAGHPVIVDLNNVHYMDSSGIAALVEGYQSARRTKSGFVLAAVSEGVARILQLARLDKVFVLSPTREAAMAKVMS